MPLSYHHQHALVVALSLKKGGSDSSEYTYKELLRELIEFWTIDGEVHFQDEESILLPLYLRFAKDPNAELVKEVLFRHAEVKALIQDVRERHTADYELVNRLGERLEEVVRLEERELFPLIEEAVPDKYLYEAKGRFHQDSVSGY